MSPADFDKNYYSTRVVDYQKTKQEWLEQQRREKEEQELLPLRQSQLIESEAKADMELLVAKQLEFVHRMEQALRTKQEKLEMLRWEKKAREEQQEMAGATFHPQTNDKFVDSTGIHSQDRIRDEAELVAELSPHRPRRSSVLPDDHPSFHELREKPEIAPLSHELSVTSSPSKITDLTTLGTLYSSDFHRRLRTAELGRMAEEKSKLFKEKGL